MCPPIPFSPLQGSSENHDALDVVIDYLFCDQLLLWHTTDILQALQPQRRNHHPDARGPRSSSGMSLLSSNSGSVFSCHGTDSSSHWSIPAIRPALPFSLHSISVGYHFWCSAETALSWTSNFLSLHICSLYLDSPRRTAQLDATISGSSPLSKPVLQKA